jgi:hypothetical protein
MGSAGCACTDGLRRGRLSLPTDTVHHGANLRTEINVCLIGLAQPIARLTAQHVRTDSVLTALQPGPYRSLRPRQDWD